MNAGPSGRSMMGAWHGRAGKGGTRGPSDKRDAGVPGLDTCLPPELGAGGAVLGAWEGWTLDGARKRPRNAGSETIWRAHHGGAVVEAKVKALAIQCLI